MEVNLEKKVREARYQRTKVILFIRDPAVVRFPDTETASFRLWGGRRGFFAC